MSKPTLHTSKKFRKQWIADNPDKAAVLCQEHKLINGSGVEFSYDVKLSKKLTDYEVLLSTWIKEEFEDFLKVFRMDFTTYPGFRFTDQGKTKTRYYEGYEIEFLCNTKTIRSIMERIGFKVHIRTFGKSTVFILSP